MIMPLVFIVTSWWRHKPFPSNLDRIFLQELLSRQLSLKNNCEDRDMIDFQNWFELLISTSGSVSGFGPGPKINNRLSVTKGHNSIPKEVWQVQKVHLNWNTLSTSTPGIHEPKPVRHGPGPEKIDKTKLIREIQNRTSEIEARLGQGPDLSWNRTSPDLSQCRSVDPCMNHQSCSQRLFYELLFYLQINKKGKRMRYTVVSIIQYCIRYWCSIPHTVKKGMLFGIYDS